ncbi:MAG: acetyl-CoA C-acyltransferase, partial [Alphaproteobacteria bacterium]
MTEAFICDTVRTPIGRWNGALAKVRADDLGAIPLKALMARNTKADFDAVDDVFFGNTNQAGEDNRNVARMSSLLAGLSPNVAGVTVNRLCGSGLEAVGQAARAIKADEGDFMIAGGVESMTRAPYVMAKGETAFDRGVKMYDTSIGWRFINPQLHKQYGTEAMPETAENVAAEFQVSREDQDKFAAWSQSKAVAAQENGRLAEELCDVTIPQRKADPIVVNKDEHPRAGTTAEGLAKLPTPFREGGSVTAGNASGVNDGAAALLVASEGAAKRHGLEPKARIVGMTSTGVEPRIMGIGPAPASQKLLKRLGLSIDDMSVIEL